MLVHTPKGIEARRLGLALLLAANSAALWAQAPGVPLPELGAPETPARARQATTLKPVEVSGVVDDNKNTKQKNFFSCSAISRKSSAFSINALTLD